MQQRPLPLDHVPMLVGRIRCQQLGRPRREVGNDRVHRNAGARNHDPGLTSGTEIRVDAAKLQGSRNRKRRIFLAQRAIGSDGQETLARSLPSAGHRNTSRWLADVDQPAAVAFRRRRKARNIVQPGMHAAHDVETGSQRFFECRNPAFRNEPARVRNADDERACAGLTCPGRC